MNFNDILSSFVGNDIIVDNAKTYHPMNCISNHQSIDSSMPPLQRLNFSQSNRRIKRKSNRKQQQLSQEQEKRSHILLSLSSLSSSSISHHAADSIIIMKTEKKNRQTNKKKTLLIPSKYFHNDNNETSKRRNDDRAPMAPIRRTQSYYVTADPQQQHNHQIRMSSFSSPISKSTMKMSVVTSPLHKIISPLPLTSNSSIARVA